MICPNQYLDHQVVGWKIKHGCKNLGLFRKVEMRNFEQFVFDLNGGKSINGLLTRNMIPARKKFLVPAIIMLWNC